ncbi:MAG TPA: preprotein translocase subunit YajC [Bacteroidales bacterium]|nr:preprotein translocase subunit YajC [Bacteroidales bacterium]
MTLATILLQAAAAAGQGSMMSMLLPMLLIFVVFYFFMIRPQNKKQKEIQKARAALKAGDRVVTSGGIFGKIKDVKDDSFIIEISENVRIRVEKSAVFAAGTEAVTEEKK